MTAIVATMPVDSLIAEVAPLSDAVAGTLSYSVPAEFHQRVGAGVAVIVPLRSRLVAGIVIDVPSPGGSQDFPTAPARKDRSFGLKPIHSILDDKPALNAAQLELARWMSAEYSAPLGRCCSLMVPPGFTPSSAYLYMLPEDSPHVAPPADAADPRSRVLTVLRQRGPMIESKLKTALRGMKGWRGVLKGLVQAGVVVRTSTLEPGIVKPRRTTMAQLTISDTTLDIVFTNLDKEAASSPRRATAIERRANVLAYLQQHSGLAWAEWIFAETGANRADLDWLAQRDYIVLGDAERWRDPLADIDYVATTAPPLTGDQARAWEAIRRVMAQAGEQRMDKGELRLGQPGSSRHFLVRGVTGSGKTEVYMRAVEMALQRGYGALVLVPEISLTPQTARRFLSRFPGKVALIHSRLKPGERFDTWRRIRSGELTVVVGARSALFAPLPNLGVIVLDEEHDQSYKQGSPPYYDSRRVAMRYSDTAGATLILGSATPSLESWRMAEEGALQVLELPNRVRGHAKRINDQQERLRIISTARRETDTVVYQPLPDVQVIDMRAELRGGNLNMFSGALSLALGETLQRGEQAILFLNRRGSASCVICRDCGYVLRCPNDDVPLTYHQTMRDDPPSVPGRSKSKHAGVKPGGTQDLTQTTIVKVESLRCHQCDRTVPVPVRCPACGKSRIRFIGIGTQKVEQAIHEQFPRARIVRWDKDASISAGRTGDDQLLQRFVNQQADVLVGTQMIAKGLDLPLVTLVGVVLADVGLFLPDFRAAERVFELIEQVAGRAGRGLLGGRVIIQTYNPDHPAVAFAAEHDVSGFAAFELAQRKMLRLPPYVRLVRFETSHEDNAQARQVCERLARELRRRAPQPGDVIGPAQAYFTRRNNRYRWNIFVRTQSPRELLDGLEVPRSFIVDVDSLNVL